MTRWWQLIGGALLACGVVGLTAPGARAQNSLVIRSAVVDGKTNSPNPTGVSLGTSPKEVLFSFGPASNSSYHPLRLRYKLEGVDSGWRENVGLMGITVRFYNAAGDQISQKPFEVLGESAGWQGDLKRSRLTHRREALVAPPNAAHFWIVISSAGPPNSVGVLVVHDLVISKSTSGGAETLLRFPFDRDPATWTNNLPYGWIRDGTHPSMARIVELGENPVTKAFAVLDDDPTGHAEWHNIKEIAPAVAPGDQLLVEWNEMYSLGQGNVGIAKYTDLPPGQYRLHVAEVTALGTHTGVETSLSVIVLPSLWRRPAFLVGVFLVAGIALFMIARYVVHLRMRREMVRLENQRALEQERLRIAHDIHDDLGARVTQISLLSAMAHDNTNFPEKARADFDQISRMSRELVSALYETVWAVNPENDNLDALGNFLCQMVNQLCEQGQLRRRLHVLDLPREIQISSQTRHNISMAVKEAVHNVIKHAKASELTLRINLVGRALEISIQDDGAGFDLKRHPAGNGLANMKHRLESIGGRCEIESAPGKGATVRFHLILKTSE